MKETKEQRKMRMCAKAVETKVAEELYKASLPKRMMDAHALAQKLYVNVSLKLGNNGPILTFHDENKGFYETKINYDTEEWEIDIVERNLNEIVAANDAAALRYQIAKAVFDTLTLEQKDAIKEHIYTLR